jgi:hypothetical protein
MPTTLTEPVGAEDWLDHSSPISRGLLDPPSLSVRRRPGYGGGGLCGDGGEGGLHWGDGVGGLCREPSGWGGAGSPAAGRAAPGSVPLVVHRRQRPSGCRAASRRHWPTARQGCDDLGLAVRGIGIVVLGVGLALVGRRASPRVRRAGVACRSPTKHARALGARQPRDADLDMHRDRGQRAITCRPRHPRERTVPTVPTVRTAARRYEPRHSHGDHAGDDGGRSRADLDIRVHGAARTAAGREPAPGRRRSSGPGRGRGFRRAVAAPGDRRGQGRTGQRVSLRYVTRCGRAASAPSRSILFFS